MEKSEGQLCKSGELTILEELEPNNCAKFGIRNLVP